MQMLKTLLMAAALLGMTALTAAAGTSVLTVPGQYATISAAVAAADADTNPANDYVISVAPGTYTNDSPQVTRPMTIQAAVPGSAVILNAPAPLVNEKGIILTFASLTVDGLTLENANIANSLGGNAAGIRAEMGSQNYTLTVRNTTFLTNQTGILTDVNVPLDVVLVDNIFMNNGNLNPPSGGTTHGLYIGGNNQSLVAIGNEICGTNVGHDIKSRASVNLIENNTLYDGAADPNQPSCTVGSTSFALDLPNGGVAVVVGNTMIRGTASATPYMFAYGEEGLTYTTNSISFIENTMDNTGAGVTAIYDNPSTPIPVVGSGNTFANSISTQVDPPSANQLTGSGGSVSPDGTVLAAPSSGNLTTTAGTWTFGTVQPQPGQYEIFLNGNYVSGWAAEIEVNNGGQLYAYNSDWNTWYVWNGGWAQSAAP
ncbi:MAG TPA: hypothetical protein VNV39_17820 [Stellaceae bacterium]|nr:hypothetical protein [Stellaceae bacterium]